MFRDKEEELQRLQEELLAQEEPAQELQDEEDLLEDGQLEALLQDTRSTDEAVIYQNFSNDYGNDLRNYASGYKAYNGDKLDVDPEEFSRQVLTPKRKGGLLVAVALLSAAVLVLVCYLYLRYRGLL